jgi:hypothetical protein
MTPEMATKQLLKEYEAARRAPAGAAPAPGAAPAAPPASPKQGLIDSARKQPTSSDMQAAERLNAAAAQLGWVGSRGSDGKMYYQQIDKTRPGRKPAGQILNEQQMAEKAGLIWE